MATFADDYVTDYVARFFPETAIQVKKNKNLSWLQTRATRLEVSQGRQT